MLLTRRRIGEVDDQFVLKRGRLPP